MDDLGPTVAERVLGEYPELLDHWRQEMRRPDRDDYYRDSGMQRMHDSLYLAEVVRQHRWLTEESGSRPDNKLARRCEEIVAAFPPCETSGQVISRTLGFEPAWSRITSPSSMTPSTYSDG